MKFDELLDEIESDFDLEGQNIDHKIRKIPNIHNKYLRLFFKEKKKLINIEKQLKSLYRTKFYYYKEDYDYKLDPKHIDWHIESDDEYSELLLKYNNQKHLVDFLEKTVRKCNSLNFDVKNLIEYRKFMSGVV